MSTEVREVLADLNACVADNPAYADEQLLIAGEYFDHEHFVENFKVPFSIEEWDDFRDFARRYCEPDWPEIVRDWPDNRGLPEIEPNYDEGDDKAPE